MKDYVIFTDSACDIAPEILKEWGVRHIQLSFRFEGEEKEYANSDMPILDFYNRMREGAVAKTAAINPNSFAKAFEEILSEGLDILYLGFSSGLSTTCNSARIAAEELVEKYPEQKITVVDTLAASAGQGMLVYLAVNNKKNGASIEETAKYIEGIKMDLCHWFTVNDLVYLKRGGRVSPAVALVGKALGIKPVLHVDNEGKLISMSKVRGRKAALSAIIEKYDELAKDPCNGPVFICHADCLDDAEYMMDSIKQKYGISDTLITDVGTVIGAHAGPGTIALFFLGKQR